MQLVTVNVYKSYFNGFISATATLQSLNQVNFFLKCNDKQCYMLCSCWSGSYTYTSILSSLRTGIFVLFSPVE